MNPLETPGYGVCHPEESQHFGETYPAVIEAIKKANDLCFEVVRSSQTAAQGENENILWMLAASCLLEFEDIFLLAGNGRGVGATKLLRAFYERVITFSYLANNQEKIHQFVGYSDVHWSKLLKEATRIHASFSISEKARRKIEQNFEASKENYQIERCPKCKNTELQGSWTKLPVGDMAQQVSRGCDFSRLMHISGQPFTSTQHISE